jgi:hypothetical protein
MFCKGNAKINPYSAAFITSAIKGIASQDSVPTETFGV